MSSRGESAEHLLTYAGQVRKSSVTVRLLYFGQLREMAGSGAERTLEPGATVGLLLRALSAEATLPKELLQRSAVAVNREYASADQALHDGDEVAILPPVSGGSR